MVFGNMGDDSGTGVAFTRDPNTGEKELYGEYLINAQGEDVVAGIRTPAKIAQIVAGDARDLRRQFAEIAQRWRSTTRDAGPRVHHRAGKLWMLQTRWQAHGRRRCQDRRGHGARGPDQQGGGRISGVEPNQVYQLLLPRFDREGQERAVREGQLLATGLNASPGAASGAAVFDADTAPRSWARRARR
jgi:pyruvate,orthophosphate dikinase